MQVFAFLLALVAIVLFLVDYFRGKSFVALGLALVTAAWMVQLVVQSGSKFLVN
jgi:hypothetical protein